MPRISSGAISGYLFGMVHHYGVVTSRNHYGELSENCEAWTKFGLRLVRLARRLDSKTVKKAPADIAARQTAVR